MRPTLSVLRPLVSLLLLSGCAAAVVVKTEGDPDPTSTTTTGPTQPTDTTETSETTEPETIAPTLVCMGDVSMGSVEMSGSPVLYGRVTDPDDPAYLVVAAEIYDNGFLVGASATLVVDAQGYFEQPLAANHRILSDTLTWRIQAQDGQGHTTVIDCNFAGKDGIAPTLNIDRPIDLESTFGLLEVAGSGSDGFDGPEGLDLSVVLEQSGNPVLSIEQGLSNDNFVVEIGDQAEGQYTIAVTLTDTSGNFTTERVDVLHGEGAVIASPGRTLADPTVSELLVFEAQIVADPSGVDSIRWVDTYEGVTTTLYEGTDTEFNSYLLEGSHTLTLDVWWTSGAFDTDTVFLDVKNPGVEDNDGDGLTPDDGDCDDSDSTILAAVTRYYDGDTDGYGVTGTTSTDCVAPIGYVEIDGDCDDTLPSINPGAVEVCSGVDEDCNGLVDDLAAGAAPLWYLDADSDNYGDPAAPVEACVPPAGYVSALISEDCDDADATVHPYAVESCTDTVDRNCSGGINMDEDGDGFRSCEGDCDESEATGALVYPGQTEACNGLDDNCDEAIDESGATGESAWYADEDGDGYGAGAVVWACDQPDDHVTSSSDCNDNTVLVSPSMAEVCNSTDDNCDGITDNHASGAPTWYADDDSDGYGDPDAVTSACTQPSGFVSVTGDCDDSEIAAYDIAEEICDDVNNNCVNGVDERIPDANEDDDSWESATHLGSPDSTTILDDGTVLLAWSGRAVTAGTGNVLEIENGEQDWFMWEVDEDTLLGDSTMGSAEALVITVTGPEVELILYDAEDTSLTPPEVASATSTYDVALGEWTTTLTYYGTSDILADGPLYYASLEALNWECSEAAYTVSVAYTGP